MQAETAEDTSNNMFQNDNIVIDYVLRYELYRHRDLSERLSAVLNVDHEPDAFNRSTWDILFYLIQSHLEGMTPSVTDIYLSVSVSKGTAINGLTELERRGGIRKVSDSDDKRRRLITISMPVVEVVRTFVKECKERLAHAGTGADKPNRDDMDSEPVSGEPLINLLHEMSHEIRTPLTAIIGFSDMIAEEALGPVQPVGYAEYARDIGKAASDLLNSLNERVDTALAEHGVMISLGPMVRLDLEEIVDAACRLANDGASRRGVNLRRKWGAKNSIVLADKERLTQAIRKLVEGVVSTIPRGHTVDIETSVLISERAPHVSVRILSEQPSAQPDPTLQRFSFGNQEMLERDLILIGAIVEAHKGYVLSDGENENSKFHSICLPLKP